VEDEDLIDVLVEAGDGAGGLRALFAALPRQPGFRFHRIQP
jgi:hypothetical protein